MLVENTYLTGMPKVMISSIQSKPAEMEYDPHRPSMGPSNMTENIAES